MSEIAHKSTQHATYSSYVTENHTSHWVGWIGFGSVVMILSGIVQAIAGLVGIFKQTFYAVSNSSGQLLVINNIHAWGWVNLITGIVVLLAGVSLLSGTTWARIIAVIFAGLAVIVNMVSMPLYPIWSIISIVLAVLVMYAVIAHGRELSED